MLKIKLVHEVNRFYKIFGEAFDMPNTRLKLRDLKNEWAIIETPYYVQQALEANADCFDEDAYEMDRWLNALDRELEKLH